MCSLLLHGKKCIGLHKVCNFRAILVSLSQNASNSFSSATASDSSLLDHQKEKTLTVPYLIESLGLTSKLVESMQHPNSVLKLFRDYGFKDSQIYKIVRSYPLLLAQDPQESLLPKLQAMKSRGASSSELIEIVTKAPKILGKRRVKSTGLYYDFIKYIIHNDKEEERGGDNVFDSSLVRKQGNKIRNISVLRELGVPQRFLFSLLMSKCQPVCGKEKFEESVKRIVEMGFDPTTSKFVQALHVVYGTSEKTIEEKVSLYEKLGFKVSDVWEMFKKWPYLLKFSEKKITQTFETLKKCGLVDEEVILVMKKRPECMRASEEKITNSVETFLELGFSRNEFKVMVKCFPACIGLSSKNVKKKIEFLVGKMNWPLKEVVMVPPVLGYSFEKRIVPRCNVIKALVSKGMIKGGNGIPPMASVLTTTDQAFLNRFVMRYDKLVVPELMAIFNNASLAKGTMKEC